MKRTFLKFLFLSAVGTTIFTSCKKEEANQAPSANIAAIASAAIEEAVTLDGSLSTDPESGVLIYSWVLDTKPAGSTASLTGGTSSKATFTPDVEGTYKATLMVTDNGALTGVSTITVTVDYKVAGYKKADEVAAGNLIAYWGLNGDGKEAISGAVPATSVNATFVDAKKGKGVSFTEGYLAYPEIDKLKSSIGSMTVSAWVKVKNNGTSPSCFFSLSRPNEWAGNFNLMAETGWYKDANDTLVVKSLLVTKTATDVSWQDTRNDPPKKGVQANKVAGTWAHVVASYDGATSMFKVYVNGVKVSNPEWELRGTTGPMVFTTPTKAILGTWNSVIDKKAEDWQKGMTGQMDEVRIFNKALADKDIDALYKLENKGL
jgi:Concanavalin A-like lectin/glucanases superfamily/PKD domain